MNRAARVAAAGALSLCVALFAASTGSRNIRFLDTCVVFLRNTLPFSFFERCFAAIPPMEAAIVWEIRFPRALLAFLAGGALSLSGAVFQSVLKNPLASPYMLGVSAGASFGAGLVLLANITLPFLAAVWSLPCAGFLGALAAVLIVCAFSARLDKSFSNNTVVLCGMVFSLFINAGLTILIALRGEEMRTLIMWQMGSFAFKSWSEARVMFVFLIIGAAGLFRAAKEMDILSFGEMDAKAVGVDTGRAKGGLLLFATILAGSAVSLSGIIGFVDLIAPHLARRLVGPVHAYMLPMSFFTGGALLTLSDILARTIISPSELPVGAITALIGAPFFAYLAFSKRR
jgi:iron complex transport system permease protein